MTLWNRNDFHVSLENPILPFTGALEGIVALLHSYRQMAPTPRFGCLCNRGKKQA